MLRKLTEGEYIRFTIPADLHAPPQARTGSFVETPIRNCSLDFSTGVFTKTRAVSVGTRFSHASKQHRNFRWLPYSPGGITTVATGGMDVLSGKFSGCWMIAYQVQGRPEPHVAHVGTVDTSEETNDKVKVTWNNFAGGAAIRLLAGFKPSETFRLNPPVPSGKDSIWVMLGGISCHPEPLLYSIGLYGQRDDSNHYRIAAIRPIQSVPLPDIQHLLLTTDVRRA